MINKINNFRINLFKMIDLTLFLLAMFLIKIPPFYISPFTTKFLTSHVVAKLILGGLFIFFIFDSKIRTKLNSKLLFFPFLFFLSQTLSVIKANDILLFLKDYQNVVFAFFIFLMGYIFVRGKDNLSIIYNFILTTGLSVIIIDFTYLLFSAQFISFIKVFVQQEMLPVYILNLERERFNLYLNTELFLPFFINVFLLKKHNKSLTLIAIFLIIFLTFVSNFRHRLLFLVMSLISYGILIIREKRVNARKVISILLIIFVIGTASSLLVTKVFFQHDIINRLLLQNEFEDIFTINSRVDHLKQSASLMTSSPIFGIGLGNYQLYNNKNSTFSIIDPIAKQFRTESSNDPHSIISKTMGETGLLGLVTLAFMILNFMIRDIYYFREKKLSTITPFIIAFWGFFILSLITPSITIFRGGWMWFLRGILEGQYQLVGVSRKSSKNN